MMMGSTAPAPIGAEAGVPSAFGAVIGPFWRSQCITNTTM